VHGLTSSNAPLQYVPSCEGAGLEHVRSRDENPAQPSVLMHCPQDAHSVNCPSIAENKN
jgi:hypothetical protein